jgi:hypothetical protein
MTRDHTDAVPLVAEVGWARSTTTVRLLDTSSGSDPVGPVGLQRQEDSSYPYSGPDFDELEPYLNNALAEWAEIAFAVASLSCSRDHVDNSSCAWYHGSWSALRVLDVVSSPAWHRNFYSSSLSQKIKSATVPRILITGTADFSIVALVLAALKEIDSQPEIHIIDLCQTPLDSCLWYSRRTGGKVAVHKRSVLDSPGLLLKALGGSSNEPFDLIVTDALLTRFESNRAVDIIESWSNLLRPGGSVITTVRLHPRDGSSESASNISDFVDRVANSPRLGLKPSKISDDELVHAARVYAQSITSHNLGDVEDIISLFTRARFVIEHQELASVKGELTPTKYMRLVAQRTD